MTAEEQWQHMWELQQLPRTPGTAGGLKSPMTPRSRAFGDLEGGYSNGTKPANGWYGAPSQAQQPVSPVFEDQEYVQDGKGKPHTGAAY